MSLDSFYDDGSDPTEYSLDPRYDDGMDEPATETILLMRN